MPYLLSKKNILFLHSNLDVGGAQRMRLTLLGKLDRYKYNVKICCLTHKGYFGKQAEKMGFNVDVLKCSNKMYNFFTTLKLLHYIKKNKFLIVQSSLFHANFHARIAARLAGVPIIITEEHGECYHYNKGIKFLPYIIADKILSLITDKIICCSAKMKDFLVSLEKISPKKIEVILNSIDENSLLVKHQKDKIKKDLHIPSDYVVIGTVGNLSIYKAQHVLLRAFAEIIKTYPKTVLVIVGNGPLRQKLEEYTKNIKITENVIFVGQRSDIADLLNIMDIFVLSSMSEGFPVSLLESMYMGIPSIAPNTGGVSEILENGKTGYTFLYPSYKDLANIVINLLTHPELTKQISIASREKVLTNFLSERYIFQLEKLYHNLLYYKLRH